MPLCQWPDATWQPNIYNSGEQHPVPHPHGIAHEVARLVVAHPGPRHRGLGRGPRVVHRDLAGFGFHEPVVFHGGEGWHGLTGLATGASAHARR